MGLLPAASPCRSPAPVGLLRDASGERLPVSVFGYKVAGDTTAPAGVTENCRVLVSGRRLSAIVGTVRREALELSGSLPAYNDAFLLDVRLSDVRAREAALERALAPLVSARRRRNAAKLL
ncbi:hypothetical protein [Streptomyces sp. NPDC056948]|uniref:hypothetical protein n=1 Tax=Streptomyces sp. NPDC056948 TaxID=3345975 RepID=UPI003629DFE3